MLVLSSGYAKKRQTGGRAVCQSPSLWEASNRLRHFTYEDQPTEKDITFVDRCTHILFLILSLVAEVPLGRQPIGSMLISPWTVHKLVQTAFWISRPWLLRWFWRSRSISPCWNTTVCNRWTMAVQRWQSCVTDDIMDFRLTSERQKPHKRGRQRSLPLGTSSDTFFSVPIDSWACPHDGIQPRMADAVHGALVYQTVGNLWSRRTRASLTAPHVLHGKPKTLPLRRSLNVHDLCVEKSRQQLTFERFGALPNGNISIRFLLEKRSQVPVQILIPWSILRQGRDHRKRHQRSRTNSLHRARWAVVLQCRRERRFEAGSSSAFPTRDDEISVCG